LKDIVAACGEQIFSNKTRLQGILADVTANVSIRNLILLAVNNNIHGKLKNNNSVIGIDSIKYQFATQNILQKEPADYIVDSFAYALGVTQSMGNIDLTKLKNWFYNDNSFTDTTKEPDVYVVGYEEDEEEYRNVTLWKNGVAQRLTDGKKYASAKSVFVSRTDVYVVGKGYYFVGDKYNEEREFCYVVEKRCSTKPDRRKKRSIC